GREPGHHQPQPRLGPVVPTQAVPASPPSYVRLVDRVLRVRQVADQRVRVVREPSYGRPVELVELVSVGHRDLDPRVLRTCRRTRIRPGKGCGYPRVEICWTAQALPSGSLKKTNPTLSNGWLTSCGFSPMT